MRVSPVCPPLLSPGNPTQHALEFRTPKMRVGVGWCMPEGNDSAEPGSHAPLWAVTNGPEQVSARHPRRLLCAAFLASPSEVEGSYLETGDFSFITHHLHKEGEVAARGDARRQSTVAFPDAGSGSVMTNVHS